MLLLKEIGGGGVKKKKSVYKACDDNKTCFVGVISSHMKPNIDTNDVINIHHVHFVLNGTFTDFCPHFKLFFKSVLVKKKNDIQTLQIGLQI